MTTCNHAAEAAGDSAALHRELLDQLGSGVAIYKAVDDGDDFVFVQFNAAAEQIERISRDDVIGRRVTEVFPGVDEFGLLPVLRRVWRSGAAEHHPLSAYRDARISGWRENQVFRLPSGEVVAVYQDRTAEKQAQARVRQLADALSESEHRFRRTFEQAAVGMAHIGLDGRFLRINEKLCEITGYTKDELQARTFQDITHPDDLNADLALADDLWAGRIPHYRIAKRYLRPDGSIVWINLTASAVRDEAGRPEYGIAVVEDITVEKAAERLRASEHLQRMALSASDAGAWECDMTTGEQVWSPETYDLFGLDPTRQPPTFAEWLSQCVHPDDREQFAAVTETGLTEPDRPFEIEFRSVHPKKGQRWLISLGQLIRDPQGRPVRSYGLNLDITERREMEEALRTSEARLRMAMAAGDIGVWEWGIGSGGVTWSDNLKRFVQTEAQPFSYTYEAFRERVHPDDLDRVEAALARAVAGESDYRLEFRMVRSDGSIRWTDTRGALVRDPQGRPDRMIGIDMDITARKAAEARQSMLASELNHRVKNLMATVGAIMRATLRTAPSLEAFRKSFSERMGALARGSDLLVRGNWEPLELSMVLHEALASFGGSVRITAPERGAQLTANGALGLNLILHELATNAAKYGARAAADAR